MDDKKKLINFSINIHIQVFYLSRKKFIYKKEWLFKKEKLFSLGYRKLLLRILGIEFILIKYK